MSLQKPESAGTARAYRFGDFELDLDGFRLTLRGQPVRLERRPFELLVVLVSRHGQLVPRDELITRLWPGNVIIDFESGLNTLIRKIRQALGDPGGRPVYVETVPGRGYRFIAPVAVAAPGRTSTLRRISSGPLGNRRWWVPGLLALILAGAITALWPGSESPHSTVTAIAVLPFENHTGNAELGYLASGLAEETSVSLAGIDPARVRLIGGVSARTIAESPRPIAELGRELGVDYLVRSSLQADGAKVRFNTHLLRVADNQVVWSATFDRELINVLGLQRDLSLAIAEQVRLRLSPEVADEIDRRHTHDPAAYGLYLRGRHIWGQFTPTANRDALRYYEQAVAHDPGYALAWAGIAQALAIAPMTTDADPAAVAPPARDAARRAIQYGPDLADTRYAEAYVRLFLDWDTAGAEAAAREAVRLDPNNALAHMFFGVVLAQLGEYAEAQAMMRRARSLDPLFAQVYALSSMVARQAEDYQAAMEFARQAIAMQPGAWVGHLHLGSAHFAMNDLPSALHAFADANRLSNGNSKPLAAWAYVLARMGNADDAAAVLAGFEAKRSRQYFPPYAMAVVCTALGDVDAAFDWLERALTVRDVHMLGIEYDLQLQPLRSDPRFGSVLSRRSPANAGTAELADQV